MKNFLGFVFLLCSIQTIYSQQITIEDQKITAIERYYDPTEIQVEPRNVGSWLWRTKRECVSTLQAVALGIFMGGL